MRASGMAYDMPYAFKHLQTSLMISEQFIYFEKTLSYQYPQEEISSRLMYSQQAKQIQEKSRYGKVLKGVIFTVNVEQSKTTNAKKKTLDIQTPKHILIDRTPSHTLVLKSISVFAEFGQAFQRVETSVLNQEIFCNHNNDLFNGIFQKTVEFVRILCKRNALAHQVLAKLAENSHLLMSPPFKVRK